MNKRLDQEEYRPLYHFSPKKGWINDPNGFVYFNGQYHLFYQHFKGGAWPGPMSWGHAVSKDLVKFEELPLAFTHDSYYDKDGCWSGSSIVKDNKLYIIYTGNCMEPSNTIQTQNLVVSSDGLHFKKYKGNPIISKEDLPEDCSYHDFRDPSLFRYHNQYYCLLGNQTTDHIAQLLLYTSKTCKRWKYARTLIKTNDLGYMIECPTSAKIGKHRVLIMSPQGLQPKDNDFWNMYSSVYVPCSLSMKNVPYQKIREIDHGLDFYAPQVISEGNIMVAWMQMWERKFPLCDMGYDWTGVLTLPRKLELVHGKLIQKPVDSLASYFGNRINFQGYVSEEQEILGERGLYKHIHLSFYQGNDLVIRFFKKGNEYIELKYENGLIRLDRRHTVIPLRSQKPEMSNVEYRQVEVTSRKITLDIYLDRICVEVFINGGKETMSLTCYHPKGHDQITFASSAKKKINVTFEDFLNE